MTQNLFQGSEFSDGYGYGYGNGYGYGYGYVTYPYSICPFLNGLSI
jgi:hypothetical protein